MSIINIEKIFRTGRSFPIMIVLLFFMDCQPGSLAKEPAPGIQSTSMFRLHIGDRFELPKSLREISGIYNAGALGLWAINDEKGKMYHLDTADYSVIEKVEFSGNGDYEALNGIMDTFYCLRSNGRLFKLLYQEGKLLQLDANYIYGLPYGCEVESLAIKDGQLFTICKKQYFRKDYSIFQIQHSSGRYHAQKFCDWTDTLNRYIRSIGYPDFAINPTDLTYDPESRMWIMLSTKPSGIFFVSNDSKLIFANLLNENIWPQPEGIALMDDSLTYVLTTEGKEAGHIGIVSLVKK